MSFRRAANRNDLWIGEMKGVVVEGVNVLLVSLEDGVRAYEDRCAHKGVALSAGHLAGTRLACSAHQWEYDVSSGRGINPERVCLRAFAVVLDGDDILVDVGAAKDGFPRGASPAREADEVGPVLQHGAVADAVIAAIRQLNADVRVVDRGAYLRVLCRGTCVVTRAAIEAQMGVPFHLPGDLELVMSSFKGRFAVSDDEARWGFSAPATPGQLRGRAP